MPFVVQELKQQSADKAKAVCLARGRMGYMVGCGKPYIYGLRTIASSVRFQLLQIPGCIDLNAVQSRVMVVSGPLSGNPPPLPRMPKWEFPRKKGDPNIGP